MTFATVERIRDYDEDVNEWLFQVPGTEHKARVKVQDGSATLECSGLGEGRVAYHIDDDNDDDDDDDGDDDDDDDGDDDEDDDDDDDGGDGDDDDNDYDDDDDDEKEKTSNCVE